MDGVHVIDEVAGDGDLGEDLSQQFVVVQILDDEVDHFESSVGLDLEIGVALQIGDCNIGEGRVQLLDRRMQNEVPGTHRNYFLFYKFS